MTTVPPSDNPKPSAPPPLPPKVTVIPAAERERRVYYPGEPSEAERIVLKAVKTAFWSAVTEVLFGVAGIVLSIVWFSLPGILVCVAVTAVGCVEWVGSRRLRRGVRSAPSMLAANQIALFAAIGLYCGVQIMNASAGGADAIPISSELVKGFVPDDPDVRRSLDDGLQGLFGNGSLAQAKRIFYGVVVVLSAVFQGWLAYYYYTRRRVLEEYRSERSGA